MKGPAGKEDSSREGIIVGLDLGSTSAKMAVYSMESERFVRFKKLPSHSYIHLYEEAREFAPVSSIYCTGYHRSAVESAGTITEITAATVWAERYFRNASVIIDIGGQDIKVIDLINSDFRLNDKCSAGTGAFLELFASHFGVRVSHLGELHRLSTSPADITNTCAVFALSEVISLSVRGTPVEDIIAGLHYSFARRIASILPPYIHSPLAASGSDSKRKTNRKSRHLILCTGGPSLNKGLISALEDILSFRVRVPPRPQFVNAMGAVLFNLKPS